MTKIELDRYFTEPDLADALVKVIQPEFRDGETFLEPHVGQGAFVNSLVTHGVPLSHIAMNDINLEGLKITSKKPLNITQTRFSELPEMWDGIRELWNVYQGGYVFDSAPTWIIGNPPYTNLMTHIKTALTFTERHVCFLLRLAVLESQKRKLFWEANPPRVVWVLCERPTFTGGGTDSKTAYGWFWWDLQHEGPTELRWLSWR